jgi:hypothetical protein
MAWKMTTFSRNSDPGGSSLNMEQLLEYALIAEVPTAFLEHLLRNRHLWDDEFTRLLNDLAYEFRPDLAIWEAYVSDSGQLHLERIAPLISELPAQFN